MGIGIRLKSHFTEEIGESFKISAVDRKLLNIFQAGLSVFVFAEDRFFQAVVQKVLDNIGNGKLLKTGIYFLEHSGKFFPEGTRFFGDGRGASLKSAGKIFWPFLAYKESPEFIRGGGADSGQFKNDSFKGGFIGWRTGNP